MNKILLLSIALLCGYGQLQAQTLSEAEVQAKMAQANKLDSAKNTSAALEAYLIVGKNTELQRTETERKTYVRSLSMACRCYGRLKRYEEEFMLAKKLLSANLTEKERKDIGKLYAMCGCLYATRFMKLKSWQYAKARSIFAEILPYAEGNVKDKVLSYVPLSWSFEGSSFNLEGKYDMALACYQKALTGFREIGAVDDEISTLKYIADIKTELYEVESAENIYKQALQLATKTGQTKSLMDVLNHLRKLYSDIGNVQQAHVYTANMDSLVEVVADEQTKFNYYIQKGHEAKGWKQYAVAEQWYLRAKDIIEQAEKVDPATVYKHPNEENIRNYYGAISLKKWSNYSYLDKLYALMGRYDDALQYGRKAVTEYQKVQERFSKDKLSYNRGYLDLAEIYCLMGDKDSCYESLNKLFESVPQGVETDELYSLYINRGRCRTAFKDYLAALEDYQKINELLSDNNLQTQSYRMQLLALMAGVESKMGNHTAAEKHYRKYAEQAKELHGENSLKYVDAQIYLANAEAFVGNITDGCKDYAAAEELLKTLMKERIPYMNAAERESLWNTLSALFAQMTPYALEAKQMQTAFTKRCYDALVMSKSFLLESERSMYDVVKRKGTSVDMHDYTMLATMKNQVKTWEKDYKTYADSILNVTRRVTQLENLLASRCKGYSDGTDFMNVDYDAVQHALAEDEVLVDFTDYVSASQGRKYAAYVIDKEQNYPLLKPLFAERQIDSLAIVRPDMFYDENCAPDVLKLLWEPLKANVPEGATVYYVPSQLLFQISLESLPLADGSLLGNHYNFVRLSSARELLRQKTGSKNENARTAVLYGGLQYDLEQTTMVEEAKKYDLSQWLDMRGDVARGDSVFHELRGSKEEILKIASILKGKKWQVTSYMGKEGTEESFLSLHGKSPQILQIATHGFYYTPSNAAKVEYLKGYTDAMSLSGLVMSGGNAAWLGKSLPKGVLGGILTANDIARLDLSNTDMVVLSSCKSGQGKPTSEGLYGLQRAFKKAGVGTIVMSLWNVDDKVTSEFMTAFYEQLVQKANAWNKRKAFEKAKAIVRKNHPEPFYWAAFVMLD